MQIEASAMQEPAYAQETVGLKASVLQFKAWHA